MSTVSSGTSNVFNIDNTSNSTNASVNYVWNSGSFQTAGNGCNESSKHNNEEKAFYHGMKSAYRMSREPDGEYGTEDPPWETAARIAANVAIAFFETTDNEYTREESFEYLEENIFSEETITSRLMAWLGYGEEPKLVMDDDLEKGLGKAWTQVDDKWNHYDAARTALAIAEAYLGERLYEP